MDSKYLRRFYTFVVLPFLVIGVIEALVTWLVLDDSSRLPSGLFAIGGIGILLRYRRSDTNSVPKEPATSVTVGRLAYLLGMGVVFLGVVVWGVVYAVNDSASKSVLGITTALTASLFSYLMFASWWSARLLPRKR